jgi:hypothetical protein
MDPALQRDDVCRDASDGHKAIGLHIAGMREDNQPVPEPSSQVEYLDVEAAAQ